MYDRVEKPKQMKSRAIANNAPRLAIRNSSNNFAFLPQPTISQLMVIQRDEIEDFNKIKNLVSSYSQNPTLKANVDNKGNYDQKIKTLKGYKALSETEKLKVYEQVKMKIKHESLGTVEPEDNTDIKDKFNNAKSCVITALMYSEGGTVLGTSSVKELHYLFYKQFPKWRQYSDDDVHAQIYKQFGYNYTALEAKKKRSIAVTDAAKTKGMTASDGEVGHMVGFMKDGQSYNFRDNDHGEAGINAHATKNDMVNKLWWK